jgi:hypothetical protein
VELQIGQSCSNLSVARSINCKTALPWIRISEFGSNTPWLRLGVFEPTSPQPCLRGVFEPYSPLTIQGKAVLQLLLRTMWVLNLKII